MSKDMIIFRVFEFRKKNGFIYRKLFIMNGFIRENCTKIKIILLLNLHFDKSTKKLL